MPRVYGFSNLSDVKRTANVVRKVEKQARATGFKYRRYPKANPVSGSSGGVACEEQNCILQIHLIGPPTGGTWTLNLSVNQILQALTINYNDNAAAVQTAIEGHTQLSPGDVSCSGGPLPDSTIDVEFIGNFAKTDIQVPGATWTGLTGTGVAVINSKTQLGFPDDA